MSRTEVTDYKTKRINAFTGGKIEDHEIPNYPKSKDDDGLLTDSFMSKDGTYMGNYSDAWWYFKKNLVVCPQHPHGVAYLLKQSGKVYPYWDEYNETGEINVMCLEGIYGYSHRGGSTFKIGDRIFDPNYTPKKEDYSAKEWRSIEKDFEKYLKQEVKDGYQDDMESARKNLAIADVVKFTMRGEKVIESWQEAIDSASNLSSYLG
jgi:hypothetical protein